MYTFQLKEIKWFHLHERFLVETPPQLGAGSETLWIWDYGLLGQRLIYSDKRIGSRTELHRTWYCV